MSKNVIFETEQVAVKSTGQDYDFVAVIENKTDDFVAVMSDGAIVSGDAQAHEAAGEDAGAVLIKENGWAGLLADAHGMALLATLTDKYAFR